MAGKDNKDDAAPQSAADKAATAAAAKVGTADVAPMPAAAAAGAPAGSTVQHTAGGTIVTSPMTPAQPERIKPFLSEGMRNDLETNGWAVDPVSGARYELNLETGEVTVTEKGVTNLVTGETAKGEVTKVDVEVAVPATVVDPVTGHTTVTDPETGKVTVTDSSGNVISGSNPDV